MNNKTYIGLSVVALFIVGIFAVVIMNKKTDEANNLSSATTTSLDDLSSGTDNDGVDTNVYTTHSTTTPTQPPPTKVVVITPVADTTKKSIYKDGTYTVTASYNSPAGTESIGVSLTLKNGIITDATVTPLAKHPTSERYQEMFISGYKAYVIGKDIATLNLGVVSGSSLTPIGFNNALAQIKAQASA